MTDKRAQAYKNLNIPINNRNVLCLDGGGIRGILTLQLLKEIEKIAGIPCYDLFDMIGGTSTGGIIAGLIATGHDAEEIEGLYIRLVEKVFTKKKLGSRYLNPPRYSKRIYRQLLKEIIGDDKTLQDACSAHSIDLMITAKDVAAGEETFFTCFQDTRNGEPVFHGTYKDVLLRGVMEATMSAPTYFTPLERFVDGGTTTYNNPSLAAIMEAVEFSQTDKYHLDKLTVFNLGTGTRPQFIKPEQVANPKGLDLKFWLNWVMKESGHDASDMQTYLLRSKVFEKVDYRRFQVSLDSEAMVKLPNRNIKHVTNVTAEWLWDLKENDLKNVELDDVQQFDLMKEIGEAVVEYIRQSQSIPFGSDLVDERNRDLLVSRFGDIKRIKWNMTNTNGWLDEFAV